MSKPDFAGVYSGDWHIDKTRGLEDTARCVDFVIAETIRKEVARIPFNPPLTVSIGLTSFNKSYENFQHLIDIASKAIAEAKITGNRVVIKSTEEPV